MLCVDFVRKMAGIRLLVVGDLMLDVYEQATVREADERFRPVYVVKKRTYYAGGAACAAQIARALGAEVQLVGVAGSDDAGDMLFDVLGDDLALRVLCDQDRVTTTKTRVVRDGAPDMRRDFEITTPLTDWVARRLGEEVVSAGQVDAVLLSDYDKGVFRTPGIAQIAIASAPLRMLDPKRTWAPFAGVQHATPNSKEAGGMEGILQALKELPCAEIVETRGRLGAKIHRHHLDGIVHSQEVRTVEAREVDAVGAGDAFAAGFTLARAAGAKTYDAVVVGQGVARWWVLNERDATLTVAAIEEQVAIVEDLA